MMFAYVTVVKIYFGNPHNTLWIFCTDLFCFIRTMYFFFYLRLRIIVRIRVSEKSLYSLNMYIYLRLDFRKLGPTFFYC